MKFDRLPRNISPHEHGSVAPNHPSFVLHMCVYMYKYTTLVMPLFCASCELLQLSLSFDVEKPLGGSNGISWS